MTDLARELGKLGAWVRLHYVYPYPHVDQVIPLMAEGLVAPLSRHPVPACRAERAARDEAPGQRGQGARAAGEMARDLPRHHGALDLRRRLPRRDRGRFRISAQWLDEAQLDRVGAFRFEPVEGAAANALPGHVPEEVKEERYARIMERTAAISAAKLAAKVGRTLPVIIDEADDEGGATGRSQADAPEIDGSVFLRDAHGLAPGDIVPVAIEDADEHDLFGVPVGR